MEYSSKLLYEDTAGELRVLDYGEYGVNVSAVHDQGAVITDIVELGLGIPASPVLCLIENK